MKGNKNNPKNSNENRSLAVVILCNDPTDEHLRTIVASAEHFEPEHVHVVDYGETHAVADSVVEEALAEHDLHTVRYMYCSTTDQWQALATAVAAVRLRAFRHVLLVDGKAGRRPLHLGRGLQHFSSQASSRTMGYASPRQPRRRRLRMCHQRVGRSATHKQRLEHDNMMKLTGGTYQFQFNLWDRKALLAYLEAYEQGQEYQSFLPSRTYAPIAFY